VRGDRTGKPLVTAEHSRSLNGVASLAYAGGPCQLAARASSPHVLPVKPRNDGGEIAALKYTHFRATWSGRGDI